MKKNKIQLTLLSITIVCLITLVAIQIIWVLKEAKLQEAQFNRSVGMALTRIENNLEKYKNCTAPQKCTSCVLLINTLKQVTNLDSIIKSDLNYYGIDLGYEYRIVDLKNEEHVKPSQGTYITSSLSDKLQQNGFELKINFPTKRDFIIAQIGFIFISSIVLVVLVTVSFLLIYRYYKRERLLSDQIRDFVNNMTHEFKTPLTNIGFANSMISKNEMVEKDTKLSSYTSIIRTEQLRLKERVEELLKTSQNQSFTPQNIEILDITQIIEDVIESFQAQVDEKKGVIKLTKTDSDLSIEANIDQLHIVFGNLIDNALKYCELSPKIEINIQSDSEKVFILITDNGIGISSDHIKQIFEKFYRVPQGDTHDNKGFGLGLYHVKTIVEQMGGRIDVSSTKGKGSTFTVEFPKQIKK